MRRYLHTLLVCAGALAFAPAAAAQEEEDPDLFLHEGLSELSLNAFGSWESPENTDTDIFTLGAELSYGLFITDWLEVGAKGEYDFQDVDTPTSEQEFHRLLAGPQITANLLTESPIVPFGVVAGGIAYSRTETENATLMIDFDDDEVGAFWEAGGGVRVFVTDSASVNLSIRFRQLLFEDLPDDDLVVGTAGISLYF